MRAVDSKSEGVALAGRSFRAFISGALGCCNHEKFNSLLGANHSYFPDFVVRLTNGTTLLLEIKGEEREKDRAKHQAARRWVSAVNHWGQLGKWNFLVCRDPQQLGTKIKEAMEFETPVVDS